VDTTEVLNTVVNVSEIPFLFLTLNKNVKKG